MGDSRMEVRYRIAPWLREYDALGDVWRPYVMSSHRPDYASAAVTTDARGFRRSTRAGTVLENFAPRDSGREVAWSSGAPWPSAWAPRRTRGRSPRS